LAGIRMRDDIKTAYASQHGIRLLRIPYTKYDNINHIVNEAVIEI